MPGAQLPSRDIAFQHEGTEDLAINATFSRRLFTRLALKTLGRLHKPDGLCTPSSKHIIVKTGRRVHLTEAATMDFIARNTSLPVPKVYCAFIHRGNAYIVMEKIQGKDLPAAWKGLSEVARENVYAQLKGMIDEMRFWKPPAGAGVESCVGGSLYDSRIKGCSPRFGPFKTAQDFHFWLREELQPSEAGDRERDDSGEVSRKWLRSKMGLGRFRSSRTLT